MSKCVLKPVESNNRLLEFLVLFLCLMRGFSTVTLNSGYRKGQLFLEVWDFPDLLRRYQQMESIPTSLFARLGDDGCRIAISNRRFAVNIRDPVRQVGSRHFP